MDYYGTMAGKVLAPATVLRSHTGVPPGDVGVRGVPLWRERSLSGIWSRLRFYVRRPLRAQSLLAQPLRRELRQVAITRVGEQGDHHGVAVQ